MRRSRKFEEELDLRKKPSAPVDEADADHGLADEALRLQELVGNANTTAAIARSALQRDEAATEAEPMKGGAEGASVYTMTMDGIGTFELISLSLPDTPGTGGGGGTGKANISSLTVSKQADKSSPALWQHAHEGRHIPKAEIVVQRGGKTVLTIRMKDLLISTIGPDGSGEIETFEVTFAEAEWDYADKNKK